MELILLFSLGLSNYALIFMVGYFAFSFVESVREQFQSMAKWLASAGLSLVLVYILWLNQINGLSNLPYGRFFVMAYVCYFLGFGPSLMMGLIVAASEEWFGLGNGWIVLLGGLPQLGLFYYLRHRYGDSLYRKRKWFLYAALVASLSLSMLIRSIGYRDGFYLTSFSDFAPAFYGIAFVVMLTLFIATFREKERCLSLTELTETKRDLISQNEELNALYQEMTAAEETLSDNYNELFLYKEKVEHYAFHDPQTGFSNRDYLLETLNDKNRLNTDGGRYLIVFGIDHPEYYRNTFGQLLMDIIHYKVGLFIKETFEPYAFDQIYNIYGDRFAVLVDIVKDKADLDMAVNQLSGILKEVNIIEEFEINIPVHTGAVEIIGGDLAAFQWLEYAELAMQTAMSQQIKDRMIWFENGMLEHKNRQTSLERQLRKAIANGEFRLVYQPQVGLDGKVIGFEALVRWYNSELGEISPVEFIPLAEVIGFIENIGQFVIDKAMEKLSVLQNTLGYRGGMSVNASFIELVSPTYVERLLERAKVYQIQPGSFNIEMTETTAVNIYELAVNHTDALIENRFNIHLDDFGTGYSSLNHLGRFPIAVIKIDKSFIDRILFHEKTRILVELTIEYAHRLQMSVIAEGVETEEQVNVLKSIGCDCYQGFYFSKPLEDGEVMTWLGNHQ